MYDDSLTVVSVGQVSHMTVENINLIKPHIIIIFEWSNKNIMSNTTLIHIEYGFYH